MGLIIVRHKVKDFGVGKKHLWSDFERQAVRSLAATLRATIEGMFEDFYFGPEEGTNAEDGAYVLGRRFTLAGRLD